MYVTNFFVCGQWVVGVPKKEGEKKEDIYIERGRGSNATSTRGVSRQ